MSPPYITSTVIIEKGEECYPYEFTFDERDGYQVNIKNWEAMLSHAKGAIIKPLINIEVRPRNNCEKMHLGCRIILISGMVLVILAGLYCVIRIITG